MKKNLLYLFIPVIMTACSRNPSPDSLPASAADTTGLAAFQQWKAINEQKALAVYYAQLSQPAVKSSGRKTSTARAPRKRPVINDQGAMTSTSDNLAKVPAKKGWSKAAKGAVIGTTAGAVAGVLINKRNRAVGGVIGGVAGGVIGYGIGRGMDKKDGRY